MLKQGTLASKEEEEEEEGKRLFQCHRHHHLDMAIIITGVRPSYTSLETLCANVGTDRRTRQQTHGAQQGDHLYVTVSKANTTMLNGSSHHWDHDSNLERERKGVDSRQARMR